jgi:DNA-binding response OmpR family regulator
MLDMSEGVLRCPVGEPVHLSRRECEVLWVLASASGECMSAYRLARAIGRAGRHPLSEHSVKQIVYRLRGKLARAERPLVLVTRPHWGYTLLTRAEVPAAESPDARPVIVLPVSASDRYKSIIR